MSEVLTTTLVLGVMGLLFGAGLAYAARVFAVQRDERIEAVNAALPGANCGACGYPGCDAYATAVVAAGVAPDKCVPGGAAVARRVAAVMGVEVTVAEGRRVARVLCQGGQGVCGERFHYEGIADCKAAQMVGGGFKSCTWGCLGFGNCARICPFGAITMNEARLPVVDLEKCTGCGKCVEECPRGIITLIDEKKTVHVRCLSRQKGAEVRKICQKGCIACGLCAKVCPTGAITVTNNLARINYELCTNCGACAARCPTKAITIDTAADTAEAASGS